MSDQQSPQHEPPGSGTQPGQTPLPSARPQPYGPPISSPMPQFPPTPPGQWQQPAPQGTYGYTPGYGGGPGPGVPNTSNKAITAFVLAICAWVLTVFCFGIGFVAAIVALVFASQAKREIDQSGGWTSGAGFVTATKIMAWINIGLTVFGIIIFAVLIVVLAAMPGSFTTDPTFTPSPYLPG
jgi:hypothetical protein